MCVQLSRSTICRPANEPLGNFATYQTPKPSSHKNLYTKERLKLLAACDVKIEEIFAHQVNDCTEDNYYER